jgi:hypothetical protein
MLLHINFQAQILMWNLKMRQEPAADHHPWRSKSSAQTTQPFRRAALGFALVFRGVLIAFKAGTERIH